MKWIVCGYGEKNGKLIGVIESVKYRNGGFSDRRQFKRLEKHADDLFGVELEDIWAMVWCDIWEEEQKIREAKELMLKYCDEVKTIYGWSTYSALVTTSYGRK